MTDTTSAQTDDNGTDARHLFQKLEDLELGPRVLQLEPLITAVRKLEAENESLRKMLEQGLEAIRLTREYVGEEALPEVEGWAWYDFAIAAMDFLELESALSEKE